MYSAVTTPAFTAVQLQFTGWVVKSTLARDNRQHWFNQLVAMTHAIGITGIPWAETLQNSAGALVRVASELCE
jgi:hypothetical protein